MYCALLRFVKEKVLKGLAGEMHRLHSCRPAIVCSLAVLTSLSLGAVAPASAYEVFDNDKLRFGTGSEASVNTNGNLQQPFYYDATLTDWYKLTYNTYPLDNAIGIDGDGTNNWNINGTILENATLSGQVLDVSGFTVITGSKGYGTIISTGTATINGKDLELKNTYTLEQGKSFVKIVTRITNTSGTPIGNVRLWVGTRDDYVGTSDGPTKERGNIEDAAFAILTTTAQQATALKISSGDTGVLFYSTSPKANISINDCCSFSNAYNQDPATSLIQETGDGSYTLFVRMEDLADGAGEEFTWYYAAGQLADLDAIISDVATASSINFSDINKNPASNSGQTIFDVFSSPIAVTAVDNTNGVWQYSADGSTWNNFSDTTGSSVDIAASARLLSTTYYIRFVPDPNWNGTTSITYRTWDGTTGTAGSTADASVGGGAFSSNTASASITVTNTPPTKPDLVLPANLEVAEPSTVSFSWHPSTDPDGDTVAYDIYYCTDPDPLTNCSPVQVASVSGNNSTHFAGFGYGGIGMIFAGMLVSVRTRKRLPLLLVAIAATSMVIISCGDDNHHRRAATTDVTYTATGLNPATQYYWAIVATDGNGGETGSDVWQFSTQ